MAQLRQDYEKFAEREAEILVIGPDGPRAFQRTWEKESMPFVGLADPKHTVADLYNQEVSLLKLGRMPALIVVDKAGQIRYSHYGNSMSDIPANEEILFLLEALNEEEREKDAELD